MSAHLRASGALFLHIPKTGGTWVEYALTDAGVEWSNPPTIEGVTYRHCLLGMLRDRNPFVFTFVRHPLKWYESWWKFQAGIWTEFEPGVWHPQRTLENCRADDFSEFIRLCIAREPGYVSRMYEWYIGPPGFEFVNFVGHHENLADDLVRVLRMVGQDFDETRLREARPVNVSERKFGEPVWDPGLKRAMLELEAPALERYYAKNIEDGRELATAISEVPESPRIAPRLDAGDSIAQRPRSAFHRILAPFRSLRT